MYILHYILFLIIMLFKNNCSFILILSLVNYAISEFTIASLVGSAIVAGIWNQWDPIKDKTVCRYMECCNDQYLPFDMDKLQSSLSQRIFGQPLVNELVNILTAHKEAISNENKMNKKALVISLHGWSGVGKNYATKLLAESLYKQGLESKYVKLFMGKKDLGCTDLEKKKENLVATINQMVKKCSRSLIILDEIHDICPSVLDAIKPMLDHYHAVDGVDYRNSIFVFISNIGSNEIASTLLGLYEQGVNRNDVDFHDFETIIRRIAYFEGGFKKAAVISHHLIDHYVPFLPLEQHHVEMCAQAEFQANGVNHPTEQMMADALTVITYGPTEDQPIFANNGCKRLAKHIPYIIQKHKQKTEL